MDKREGLAKRIEDACGKVGVNIQGLGLENLIESSKSVAEKIPNEIEISYRTTGNDVPQNRNTTVSYVKINRTVVVNKNSSENSELGNLKSILGVSAPPNTGTSTGSRKDDSTSEPHVTITKRVIIHEGSSENSELDNWGYTPGLNVARNSSTLTHDENNEDNIRGGITAKTNVAISNDTTKEDFDTPQNILEQKVFKENSWIDETKEGFQKTAELKAYDGIATGVEKVVKSDAGATKAVALTSEGAINSAAEAISEYSGYCDIVAMMFPNQFQVAASFTISYVVFTVFTAIFDIAAVFKFDAKGLQMAQINQEIKELSKKVDSLLDAKMKSAMSRLPKAIGYLESKVTHINAYKEFEDILNKVEEAYSTVQEFEKKVFCKRTAIFARFMRDTYDEDQKEFTTLSSLPPFKQKIIASNMWHDVREMLDAFYQDQSAKTILQKMRWNKRKLEKQANQDLLDKLLKFSTPIMLFYVEDLQTMEEKDILRYIPEGIDDALILKLDENVVIKIWKDETEKNDYELKWQPTIVDIKIAHEKYSSDEFSFAEQMLPISTSSSSFFDVNHESNKFLSGVFNMTSNIDLSTKRKYFHGALTRTFHKIDKQIEEICKKNRKPISSDLNNIMTQVSKAIESLEEVETFPLAFKSFQSAAENLEEITTNFLMFDDKLAIYQISMFIDFMLAIYDEDREKFVPFGTLEKKKKANFAINVFGGISKILKEFEKLRLKKGSDMKTPETLIHVMKFSLPIMWHYKINDVLFSEALEFVPEGVENCVKLALSDKIQISIWKYEEEKEKLDWLGNVSEQRKYVLQWCPSYVFETIESSKYTWMNKRNCTSMWLNVCKKNTSDVEPWDRTSITSITKYVDEMSNTK